MAEGVRQRVGDIEEYACRRGLPSARQEWKGEQQFQEKKSPGVRTGYTRNETPPCRL